MFLISFLFLLFQTTAESIASVAIPIVVMLATIAAAYGLSLSGSRTMTVIGAVAAAYAALAPIISDFTGMPNWLRVMIIIVGVTMTTLNERIQGGLSTKAVIAFALCASLLGLQVACGPPSKATIEKLHAGALVVVNTLDVNATLPDQLLEQKIITAEQFGQMKVYLADARKGAAAVEQGLATALTSENPSLKQLAPIVADVLLNLRGLNAIVTNESLQKVFAAAEIGLRVLGSYFALQISRAIQAGFSAAQVCVATNLSSKQYELVATAYDGSRFEEYAAALPVHGVAG